MKQFLGILMAVAVGGAGCASDVLPDDRPSEKQPVDCASISAADCAHEAACRTLYAEHVNEEYACKIADEAVGCLQKDALCDDATTFARDHDGDLWWFTSLCVPEGWETEVISEALEHYTHTLCGPSGEVPACEALSEQGCDARDDCQALHAQNVDETNACLIEPVFVQCATHQECGEQMLMVRDPRQALWLFPSTCIPDTWRVDYSQEAQNLFGAPLCADMVEPQDCHALDAQICASRADCEVLQGRYVHIDDACTDEFSDVGCHERGEACADQQVLAHDSNDALWIFASTCIPWNWQETTDPSLTPLLDAEFCAP